MTDKDKTREFETWFESDAMPAESNWFLKDAEGGYAKDFVANTYYGWQAAKESSRKELEAAKQRVAELEEANTSNTFWKAEFLKEKEALEKNLAAQEKQLTSFRLAFFDIAGGEDAVQGVEELTKHK